MGSLKIGFPSASNSCRTTLSSERFGMWKATGTPAGMATGRTGDTARPTRVGVSKAVPRSNKPLAGGLRCEEQLLTALDALCFDRRPGTSGSRTGAGRTVKVQNWPASRDGEAIAVLRGLILDAAATAGSGHSGTALALAPLVHVLFTRFLAHDPAEPGLETRDRFVLSAGHAGLVIHALLHLRGFGVGLDDLRTYRRRGSRVPGHPESWMTEGIEVTTGPLGQGVANAVGIALARRIVAARDGVDPERVFVVCSDGDLMEGIALESASLAGHLGLSNLVAVHDDNRVTVDGPSSWQGVRTPPTCSVPSGGASFEPPRPKRCPHWRRPWRRPANQMTDRHSFNSRP